MQTELNCSAVVWQERKTLMSRVRATYTGGSLDSASQDFAPFPTWWNRASSKGELLCQDERGRVKVSVWSFLSGFQRSSLFITKTLMSTWGWICLVLTYLQRKPLKGKLSALGDGEKGRWGQSRDTTQHLMWLLTNDVYTDTRICSSAASLIHILNDYVKYYKTLLENKPPNSESNSSTSISTITWGSNTFCLQQYWVQKVHSPDNTYKHLLACLLPAVEYSHILFLQKNWNPQLLKPSLIPRNVSLNKLVWPLTFNFDIWDGDFK